MIVGAVMSTRSVNGDPRTVLAGVLLSVALNWIVFRPVGNVATTLHVTLLEAAVAADCHDPVLILNPTDLMFTDEA